MNFLSPDDKCSAVSAKIHAVKWTERPFVLVCPRNKEHIMCAEHLDDDKDDATVSCRRCESTERIGHDNALYGYVQAVEYVVEPTRRQPHKRPLSIEDAQICKTRVYFHIVAIHAYYVKDKDDDMEDVFTIFAAHFKGKPWMLEGKDKAECEAQLYLIMAKYPMDNILARFCNTGLATISER